MVLITDIKADLFHLAGRVWVTSISRDYSLASEFVSICCHARSPPTLKRKTIFMGAKLTVARDALTPNRTEPVAELRVEEKAV